MHNRIQQTLSSHFYLPLHVSHYLSLIFWPSVLLLYIYSPPPFNYLFYHLRKCRKTKKKMSILRKFLDEKNEIWLLLNFCKCLIDPSFHLFLSSCQIHHNLSFQHTHTHTHTHIYIYIYILMCVFIYIYIYIERERERERKREVCR